MRKVMSVLVLLVSAACGADLPEADQGQPAQRATVSPNPDKDEVLVCGSTAALATCSGVKGEQGEPGVQGEPGLPGVQGEQGPQGEAGPQGVQGEPGVVGEAGAKGPRGDVGFAPRLAWLDALGNEIRWMTVSGASYGATYFDGSELWQVEPTTGAFVAAGAGAVFHKSGDCTGDELASQTSMAQGIAYRTSERRAGELTNRIFYVAYRGVGAIAGPGCAYSRYDGNGFCTKWSCEGQTMYPLTTIEIPELDAPLPWRAAMVGSYE